MLTGNRVIAACKLIPQKNMNNAIFLREQVDLTQLFYVLFDCSVAKTDDAAIQARFSYCLPY